MSLIRGVLLAGKFRTQQELNNMSEEDQRNTLIVELTNHSNQSNYQAYDNDALAGMGAVMVFLRNTGIRDDAGLRMMSADDQRNTLIVEIGAQNPHMASRLQGFSNMDLVLLGLGNEEFGISLHQPTFIRGVLLAGKFRTQYELNQMSTEDQRNTLIVELTNHSNQSNYQAYDNYELAGMGAVMVFLRNTGIRDDAGLRMMSAEDQRNTLIVEMNQQTGLDISRLQALRNMDLVWVGLGVDPAQLFITLPPPLRPPPPPPSPIEFRAAIESGGLAALGGYIKVTINPDGSVRCEGEATNSGIDSYDFGISALVRTSSGRAVALARTGSIPNRVPVVGDTIRRSWNELQPPNPVIAAHFDEFTGANFSTNLEYESGIAEALQTVTGWLIQFAVGSAIGPLGGAVVFIGVEIGSLVTTGSLVPGARIVGNLLWLAGPANTLYAIAAEGIAAIGSRTQELSEEAYNWANNEVFLGSLPPRDKLVQTDTIGGGNRAFTFPRFDGTITLNMGPDGWPEPRNYHVGRSKGDRYPGQVVKYGEVLIHELVHACQIHHASIDLSLMADALASKVCEASGESPYIYGSANTDYSSFNLEQQAQIVSDWFAGAVPNGSNQTLTPKDSNSPYFRYVNENVRVGRF